MSSILRIVSLSLFLIYTNNVVAQDLENSYILFSNHTNLKLTTEVRVTGDESMVDVRAQEIKPWEGSNYHDLNDRIITTILDITFDIGVDHKNNPSLVKLKRSNFSGGNDHQVEIDVLFEENLLFTILYDYTGKPNSFRNLSNYNVRYPDQSLDVPTHYSLLNENGNNPHAANKDIIVDGIEYKLIYGSFDIDLDPTNNIIFSLSEKEPVSFHHDPDAQDLENPQILNVLTYNIGLLMPLNANDQEERERIPVMHQGIPKNMDVIMWQEMFEQYWVNRLIDSLINDYPYYTTPHNRPAIPGLTKNGGCLIMSKYPILEEKDYSYLTDGGIEASGESVFADKGVKYAKINKHGQTIHIFNSHTSGQDVENDAMGRFIKETVQPNYDDIVIMGGDMNTKVYLPKYYQMMDSLEAIQPNYNSLLNEQPEMQGTTWGYNHYGGGRGDTATLIDYVLANKNFKVPIVNYNETQAYRLNITDKKFWGIFDLGDHQPVYSRMEFPSMEASISDSTVCPGESFEITATTSLSEFSVEWYKDEVLLPDENQLTLSKNNITENDWGKYECYIIYSFLADDNINNHPLSVHGPYIPQGEVQGKLLQTFNVGPEVGICDITTLVNQNIDNKMKIYPNPAVNLVNIEVLNTKSNCAEQLLVYDYTSKLIYQNDVCSTTKIDISNWSNGVYTIKFVNNFKVQSIQFIKNAP